MVGVRWYLRYGLSYRDGGELLVERGIEVDHVTVFRWVQRFTPLLADVRLAYLGVTNAFAMLRLLPMSDRDKDMEILTLRHQITVRQRQMGKERVRFDPSDRAFLAALLHRLPRDVLRRLRLLVRPDTVLRWHRET